MTPKRSFLRRCLAVLAAVLVAGVLVAVGTWVPSVATGAPDEKEDRDDPVALQIVLIKDRKSGLPWPVQDRKFDVVVQVVDADGRPAEVDEPTKIELIEVSGPGVLRGNTTAVIQKDFSSTVISGAKYSKYANGVVLAVRVIYGEDLASDQITVEVALTAVGANAKPGKPLKLKDPNCAAPTSDVPTCGILALKNGADGRVTLSVGSCEGLVKVPGREECREVGDTEALVVTFIASLRDFEGDLLYSRKEPAKAILACDKALCGKTDRIKVLYTLRNIGPLKKVAPPCPKKDVIGKDQEACVDYAQSFRRNGDLYLPFLYKFDGRASI
jgi:hypothetical protein